ncbi:hypothetical protein GS496_17165 [Rhodococcus hoagii]|nr:hypothetical protein [Prescottella equi]
MSTRDELASLLDRHLSDRDNEQGCRLACGYDGEDRCEHLADAILAAGYSRPRVVETFEELQALPDETVVRDSDDAVFEILQPVAWASCPWTGEGKDFGYALTEIALPATVLYLPEEKP